MTQSVRRLRPRSPAVNAQPLRLWQDSPDTSEVRIEIVPLIDVIFCILTFFILAAVGFSRQQAISLDLPQASTGAAQMRELIVISLDEIGQVYVEQQPVATRAQLSQALENYFLTQPDGRVVLRASRNAVYDEVVQVLDLLREVGGDRVALATFPESGSPTESEFETAPALPPGLPEGLDEFGTEPEPGLEALPELPAADERERLPGTAEDLQPGLPTRPPEDEQQPGERRQPVERRVPASDAQPEADGE